MKFPEPSCDLERMFAQRAEALHLLDVKVSRTERGLLCLFWRSPCEEIGGLSLYVDEREIMLSTDIFHTHHDHGSCIRKNLPESEIQSRIVEAAIADALAIMKGERVFSITYDAQGNETSRGIRPHIQSPEAKDHERGFREQFPDMSARQREWTWFGEVLDQ